MRQDPGLFVHDVLDWLEQSWPVDAPTEEQDAFRASRLGAASPAPLRGWIEAARAWIGALPRI